MCRRRPSPCDASCWDCPLGMSEAAEGVNDESEVVSENPFSALAEITASKYTKRAVNQEGE